MLFDEEMMLKAITLAEKALQNDEAPIGAIVIDETETVIGSGFNQREQLNSPLAHAEVIAIHQAAEYKRDRRLDGCTMYVTLEPCLMCAGAIMQARLKRVVFGAFAEKTGALSSVTNVYEHRFGYNPMIRGGILESVCAGLMNKFGAGLRQE